jgi:Ca2+-binding EF-hand superfamily protein
MLLDKNPADRLTANEMLEHPWIVGDEASTEVIKGSAEKLGKFRDLRAIIEAGIFSILIEKGSKEMAMSEYTPKMVYKDDRRGSSDTSKRAPASSVLKRAFEVFDQGGKGFVSADDLNRVVTETTGQSLSDSEKNEMINPFNTDTAGSSGLSLSSFSKVAAGLKHKHFPRGHIVFRAGEIGDAMYFINSGKVEIQTKKGQLIHILRHGDFFGEGSLLDEDNRRFSTAKCATPVDLIKIKQSEFKR